MVFPELEELFLAVAPKDAIANDDKHEVDFEILDSSDVRLSTSNICASTKVETHESMKTNMYASRFRFRWWRHRHQDQKTVITPWAKRKH